MRTAVTIGALLLVCACESVALPIFEVAGEFSLGWALGASGNKRYWALLDPDVTVNAFSVTVQFNKSHRT